MGYTLKDIYKAYTKEVEEPLSKKDFYDICETFNILSMEEVIKGRVLELENNLSNISVRRVERNYKKPQVNWRASLEYKQELLDEGKELYDKETGEGEQWLIYFTDKWYCKFHWEKKFCKVKNKTAYRFRATRGLKGNKDKLKHALSEDELAYLRFKTHGSL